MAVSAFSSRYHRDWQEWMQTPKAARPKVFGALLRRCQATRPWTCRRIQREAKHPGPFLEDLLISAQESLRILETVDMHSLHHATREQCNAQLTLWEVFRTLGIERDASCVGISKAVIPPTDGRIGPAFDSNVCDCLGIKTPKTAIGSVAMLDAVAEDIQAFESNTSVTFVEAAGEPYRGIGIGRLYDMVFGPSESPTPA